MKKKRVCREILSLRDEVSIINNYCKSIVCEKSSNERGYIKSLERSAKIMEKLCKKHTEYIKKYLV